MGLLRLAQETPVIAPDASVMQAVMTMKARKVGAIAVTVAGKIVGVFTERDLMRRVVHERKDPDVTLLHQVMTSPVRTVLDSTSVAEAATLMRTHKFRHLAIVDEEGTLLGMVALRHLLYDMMDDLERKVGGLQSYLMVDGPGG